MADANVTITINAKDEASKVLRGSFTELKSKIDIVGQAFQQFSQIASAAFEFGMQGGTVAQTTKSFERLLAQVGASPDLLDRMRESTRGTVDDLSLMSSTMTLASGVSDEMARQMLEVAPQILKVAEAANALNPRLGTTEFLFQSLMTGIKRGSPMLIDNTGITLRLGEANEAYAKSLGKTVDELTDAERKQALINATLAAGDDLLRQVGGDTSNATDSFEKLAASMTNAKNAVAVQLLPALTRAADALELVLTWNTRIDEAYTDQRKKIADTSTSWGEYTEEIKKSLEQQGYTVTVANGVIQVLDTEQAAVAGLSGKTRDLTSDFSLLTETNFTMADSFEREQMRVDNLTASFETADTKTAEWGTALEDLYGATEEAKNGVKGLETATSGWIDTLDTGLSGSILNAIEKIQWFKAGGLELQLAYEAVMQNLRDDAITPDQAQAKFEQLFIKGEIIAGQVNGLTFDQIAENIAQGLNVPLSEAMGLANNTILAMQRLDGMTATVKVYYETFGGAPGSGTAAETGGRAGGETQTRQAGGPVWAGRPVLVGEAGPELFTPQSSGYITNNTTTYNMTVNTAAQSSTVIADYNLMRAMAGA